MRRTTRFAAATAAVAVLTAACSSGDDSASDTTAAPTSSTVEATDIVSPDGYNFEDLREAMLPDEVLTGPFVYDHPSPLLHHATEVVLPDSTEDAEGATPGWFKRFRSEDTENTMTVNLVWAPTGDAERRVISLLSDVGIGGQHEVPLAEVDGGPYDPSVRVFRATELLTLPDYHPFGSPLIELNQAETIDLVDGHRHLAYGIRGSTVVLVAYYTLGNYDMAPMVASIVDAQLAALDPIFS